MNTIPISPTGRRKSRSRGVALMETTIGLGGLVVVSLLLLKAAMTATTAQRWTIIQGMTDAYMTRETATAKRVPFDEIVEVDSRWPIHPTISEDTVEIGKLPGGLSVLGVIRRTRIPDDTNFPSAGGGGTTETNPAKIEVWSLQSLLSYELSGRTYVKSRTVVRSR